MPSAAKGFTLIEVVLAVVLLASALVFVVGLQTSTVTQTLRDRNREFALLAGRKIFAQMEAEDADVPEGIKEMSLAKFLEEYGAQGMIDYSKEELQRLESFTARLSSETLRVPGIDKEVMRKVTLSIWWSPEQIDSVDLLFFVPSPPQKGS